MGDPSWYDRLFLSEFQYEFILVSDMCLYDQIRNVSIAFTRIARRNVQLPCPNKKNSCHIPGMSAL